MCVRKFEREKRREIDGERMREKVRWRETEEEGGYKDVFPSTYNLPSTVPAICP